MSRPLSRSASLARDLLARIARGELRPGDAIDLPALGRRHGVSRTVVREALQRLEAQGLVNSRVGSGSYVAPYRMDHVKTAIRRFVALNPQKEVFLQLLDLRLLIETETAGRLAKSRDPQALRQLKEELDRMDAARRDLAEFADADISFHLRIAEASGNPFFLTILEPFQKLGREFGMLTYESPATLNRTRADHVDILKAIAEGNVSRARERMHEHIEFSRTHFIELLEHENEETAPVSSKKGNR